MTTPTPTLPDPGRHDGWVGGRPMLPGLMRAAARLVVAAPIPWAVFTVALYAAAIVGTALLAPHFSSQTLAWLVLIGTFTAATTSLLQLLRDRAHERATCRLSNADVGVLVRHLTEKMRNMPDTDGHSLDLVATVVADTLLVAEGTLTVDDFAPRTGYVCHACGRYYTGRPWTSRGPDDYCSTCRPTRTT